MCVFENQYDQETADDMNAISGMIKAANEQGLLMEVIYSLIQQSNKDSVSERCRHALYEWDI